MVFRRRRTGYSVVELVIAVGIFSVGIAAVYGQFRDTRQPSQSRMFLAQAQFQAQRILSEALASSYNDLSDWKPATSFTTIESQPRFSSRTSVSTLADNAIEVLVEVGWNPIEEDGSLIFPEGRLVTAKGLRFK